jgi:deoxyribodipyrimidine photo-lyase
MTTHLVWFRADLRVHDNYALAAACNHRDASVKALFIATPGQWKKHAMAPRQAAFLATHLNALQQALAERGIPLIYREVDDFAASVDTVAAVCAKKRSAIFSITTSTK